MPFVDLLIELLNWNQLPMIWYLEPECELPWGNSDTECFSDRFELWITKWQHKMNPSEQYWLRDNNTWCNHKILKCILNQDDISDRYSISKTYFSSLLDSCEIILPEIPSNWEWFDACVLLSWLVIELHYESDEQLSFYQQLSLLAMLIFFGEPWTFRLVERDDW